LFNNDDEASWVERLSHILVVWLSVGGGYWSHTVDRNIVLPSNATILKPLTWIDDENASANLTRLLVSFISLISTAQCGSD
jgi:hypothetical protein